MRDAESDSSDKGREHRLAGSQARGLLAFTLLLVFLVFYLHLFENALVDDAYISLDYARTLRASGTWGLRPGLTANSATSPLNVVLLAALGATPEAAIWLALVCFGVMALALDRISLRLFQTTTFGRIASLAFVFNPLLISTLGLESILFAALLVLALLLYLSGRWGWLGMMLGLLSITRPSGPLYAIIFLLFLPQAQARWKCLAAFALVSAPWYLFSWIGLGSFIPDTIFIKLGMAPWGASSYPGGIWMYLQRYPLEASLSFAFLLLVALLAFKPVRDSATLRLLFSLGAAHFVLYSGLNARPFHWYYAGEIDVAILFGSLALGTLWKSAQAGSGLRAAVQGVAAVGLLAPMLGMALVLARDGFKVEEMPIHANWGTAAEYEQVGRWLEANAAGESVRADAEIGTVTYYCPDCYLLDLFSDRRWLVQSAEDQRARPGLVGAVFRLNFLFLRGGTNLPPYDFVLTSYQERPQVVGPVLMLWETSTKWAPHGLMTFRAY